MTTDAPDHVHFTRAVATMAERRKVVAHCAIYNQQGLKLIDKGVTVDSSLYARLQLHRLQPPLAETLTVEDPVTALSLRDDIERLARAEPFLAAMMATPRVAETLHDELTLIPLPQAVGVHLTTLRETQPELWLHSLRATVTAGWLALRSGGTRFDVRMLCAAGLLHDLGMLHLDPVLLRPDAALDGLLRRQLYTHPLLTVMQLEGHHEYPRELLQAVLMHHESLDGTGYPRNISGSALTHWGNILALTEVVTAIMVPGRKAAGARLSLALRMNRQRFEPELVRELMTLLPKPGEEEPEPLQVDPIERLLQVDRLLHAWPEPASLQPAPAAARLAILERLHVECKRVLRMLASAGATASQLSQIGAEDTDPALANDLVLIAHEAHWQLRNLTRHVRRLWRRADGEHFPDWLEAWLAEAELAQA